MSSQLLNRQEKHEEKLRTMARQFARADRSLAKDPHLTCKVVTGGINAPAWSDGQSISFNAAQIDEIDTIEDVTRLMGLNYHELAHHLWTPRRDDPIVKHAKDTGDFDAFNILEDARIESMMVGKWTALEPYFTSTFMRYIASNPAAWPEAHALSHGRKYLPDEVRQAFADVFVLQSLIDQFSDVIDEYRLMNLAPGRSQRIENRAKYLITTFGDLMRKLPKPPQDAHGHVQDGSGQSRPDMQGRPEGSEKQKDAQQQSKKRDKKREKDRSKDRGDDEQGTAGDDQGEGSDGDSDDQDQAGTSSSGDSDQGDQDGSGGKDQQSQGTGDDAASSSSEGDDGDDDGDESDGDDDGEGDNGLSGSEDGSDDGADSDGDDELDSKGHQAGIEKRIDKAPGEKLDPKDILPLLTKHIHEAESDPQLVADAKAMRQTILKGDGHFDGTVPQATFSERRVDQDMQRIAKRIATELNRVVADQDPGWDKYKSSGRINVGRAMRGDDLDTLFDVWEEGNNLAADLEVVIDVDMSTSMDRMMNKACQAMWTIKRSVELTGGTSSVYAYSSSGYMGYNATHYDSTWQLYDREDKAKATHYRAVRANGGTQPAQSVEEAARLFYNSKRTHKLFIIITDGDWANEQAAEKWIKKLNKAGITTALVYIGRTYSGKIDNHECQVSQAVDNMEDLVRFTKQLVKTQMLKRIR